MADTEAPSPPARMPLAPPGAPTADTVTLVTPAGTTNEKAPAVEYVAVAVTGAAAAPATGAPTHTATASSPTPSARRSRPPNAPPRLSTRPAIDRHLSQLPLSRTRV